MIPYSHQSVDESDIQAVVDVLRGDWLTQGPHVEEFEESLKAYTTARYAVAFSSATAALHAAVAATGAGPKSLAVTSPLSFVASANCARYVGAQVNFVDIDPKTLNIDLSQVPECDVLIAVHFAGLPVDLSALGARPRVVIEDAAHALGSRTRQGPIGNCANSDMCVFSFHPVKAITTGEGGAVTTNDEKLATQLRRFRHHGIEPKPELGGWVYEINTLGFNYRITDIQAALGTSQLTKLERFVERRNSLAQIYRDYLSGSSVTLPPDAPADWRHSYHLFPIRVPDRARVYSELRKKGIGVQVHYIPIYYHSIYAEAAAGTTFPETERAYQELLSLPLYPDLKESEQETVVDTLRSIL